MTEVESTVLSGLVTAEQLQQAIEASNAGRAVLAPDARLTPLANDLVRQHPEKICRLGDGDEPASRGGERGKAHGEPDGTAGAAAPTVGKAEHSQRQLKHQMCEVGRRIWLKGFCAGNEGNHSVRLSEDRFLSTPTGMSKGFLDPEDLCVVDRRGRQAQPNLRGRKPTSEILLHLAIYGKRPDVQAVVHSHPPHATAFAISGIAVPEGVHPEAEVFLGKVRTAPYVTPGTAGLGQSIVALIGPHTNTVLMGNHGSVSFSQSLMDAYYKLEILDAYCRILLLTKQLGRIHLLSSDDSIF